jgi:hypothetical protein
VDQDGAGGDSLDDGNSPITAWCTRDVETNLPGAPVNHSDAVSVMGKGHGSTRRRAGAGQQVIWTTARDRGFALRTSTALG